MVSRSYDALSRVAIRARLSRKVRRAFLLWRVRMPSLIAWATPCRNPSSKARSMSWPVARERWAMAPRVYRRAVSLKVWAAAAWVASWVIS